MAKKPHIEADQKHVTAQNWFETSKENSYLIYLMCQLNRKRIIHHIYIIYTQKKIQSEKGGNYESGDERGFWYNICRYCY